MTESDTDSALLSTKHAFSIRTGLSRQKHGTPSYASVSDHLKNDTGGSPRRHLSHHALGHLGAKFNNTDHHL